MCSRVDYFPRRRGLAFRGEGSQGWGLATRFYSYRQHSPGAQYCRGARGSPIPWQNYHTVSTSPRTLTGQFRRHVYRLARNAPPIFRGVEAIAEPENQRLLEQEVRASELPGCTPDGMQIHLCKMECAPCTMRELGRLRERAFRAVGEGSGLPRDIDRFDQNYLQLVLWDPDNREAALPAGTADPLALRHCHCKRHEDNVQLPLRRASQSCRASGAYSPCAWRSQTDGCRTASSGIRRLYRPRARQKR